METTWIQPCNRLLDPVSGSGRTFWEQFAEPRTGLVVGTSVLTDLCNAAPSTTMGNTTMQKLLSLRSILASAVVVVAWAAVLAVVVMATGSTAYADDKAAAGKVKVYDFSGDTIEGDLIRPEGTSVDVRDFAKHSSLIRIRKDFIPEIIKSAEDL
jgi:hypothetical protein